MLKLTFGRYYSIYGMPSITLEANFDYDGNELPEGTTRTIGYLNSFRDYCFQVSGSYDGDGDYGCTPVFGLHTFGFIQQAGRSNLNQDSTVKYIISATAVDAVNNFIQYLATVCYKMPIIPITNGYSRYNSDSEGEKEWELFINNCFKKYVEHVDIDDVPFNKETHVKREKQ